MPHYVLYVGLAILALLCAAGIALFFHDRSAQEGQDDGAFLASGGGQNIVEGGRIKGYKKLGTAVGAGSRNWFKNVRIKRR